MCRAGRVSVMVSLREASIALLVITLLCRLEPTTARSDVDIFNMLVKNYKPEEAPDRYGSRAGFIPVEVQALVESLQVDEHGSTVSLECLLQLTWSDIRLRYRSAPAAGGLVISHATAGMLSTPQIWVPSLRFPRSLSVTSQESPDNSFMIRPNGTVTWQRRLTLKLACAFNVQYFPWDINTCEAFIRQNLDHEHLMLNWTQSAYHHVQLGPSFSINGFELTSLGAGSQFSVLPEGAGSSPRSKSLVIRLTFQRIAVYYIINDIVPTSVLVLASYMTFWLDADAVLVRCLVASFMLLASFILVAIAGQAAPAVAYLKALDVWNLFCVLLLLWALAQSLLVFHLSRRKPRAEADGEEDIDLPKPPTQNGNGDADPEAIVSDSLPPPPPTDELGPLPPRPRRRRRSAGLSAAMVDTVSRALYPIVFVIFAITFGVLCT